MSSRLARQSLDFLTKSTPKNKDSGSNKKDKKLILPKTNRGIKKVKHEIRYGQHQKTRKMQEERRKRENPIDHLKTEEELLDEKLKFNVRVMQRALKASELEKQIHKEINRERRNKKTKWSSKVDGADGDTDEDSD